MNARPKRKSRLFRLGLGIIDGCHRRTLRADKRYHQWESLCQAAGREESREIIAYF